MATLRLTNMEVENPLFVKESSLPRDHAIHFHVSESECNLFSTCLYLFVFCFSGESTGIPQKGYVI